MSTISAKELFILGRISLRPTHGHEIMRTLRASRADLWVEISEKHVYYILKKLERDGLVSIVASQSDGLAARKVYAITSAGRSAFASMLVADGLVDATPYSEFDVLFGMLCYTDAITPAEKDAILARRRAFLGKLASELNEATAGADALAGAPRVMLEKVTRNVANELDWLEDVTATIARDGWASMRPSFGAADEEVPAR